MAPDHTETGTTEQTMEAALAPFGWTCGPAFWQRYYSDPWVFNLANAVEALVGQVADAEQRAEESALRSIEARNPGIDIEEVRRQRAAHSGSSRGGDDR